MLIRRFVLLSIVLNILYISSSFAQEEKPRTVGLSAVVQNSQFDIMLPIWISPKTILAPAVSAMVVGGDGTDLGIALVPKFYTQAPKGLTPYIALRAGMLFNFGKEENTVDGLAGTAFGGEYFFNRNFSAGVEAQLNISFSDSNSARFGNPGGTNVNTGAAIMANIYF